MTVSGLVDQYGQPIPPRPVTQEIAAPTLSGARSLWHQPVASGLTPARLARIMRESADIAGDTREYLTLCEEVEEREPHFRSVIHTRKLALRKLTPVVAAPTEDASDVAIAEEVRALVATPAFRGAILHLTDGIAKGYSVVEMLWSTGATRRTIGGFKWRDPRLFQFDRVNGSTLKLRSDTTFEGEDLPPAKFIVHVPTLKSGTPARGGLARVALWVFMLKSFSLKDWMAFLDVYGIPWRVGKWHTGASDDDKRALLRAVSEIAADGAAIIPAGMVIELLEAKGGSHTDAFLTICKYLDEQLSKLILGQTMTVDDGASRAQAEVHNMVRLDIGMADADELAATIQRDMVEPFVFFNHGIPKNGFPQLTMPVIEPEDLKALMGVTGEFVDRGGKVSMAEVRDKLGWCEPGEDEETLVPKTQGSGAKDQPADEEDKEEPPPRRRARARMTRCAHCGEVHAAAATSVAGSQSPDEDALDAVTADVLAEWEPMLAPIVDPLLKAAGEAGSFDELNRKLAGLGIDSSELVKRLERATAIARGLGDASD